MKNNRKVHKVFSQSKKEKMTENEISKIIIGLAI
jgi:hypothetical protein